MTVTQKKAVLFAPFWRQEGHVGNYRVDRFVRWLADEGYTVILVRAGTLDGEGQHSWGQEITVRDPLGLHRDTSPESANFVPPRKPNKLRRALSYWVFSPDPTIVWARVAARRPLVLQAVQGAAFILSSSPPESAHVGAWLISRRTGVPHIVDMRDGWLDEPLRPLLRTSSLRRWRESRMEARILCHAKAVQVTSEVWKTLLCDRYPAFVPKVHVLTNGYPQQPMAPEPKPPKGPDDEPVLIHAGHFLGSRLTQSPDLLLEPLLHNLSGKSSSGVIQLIGLLSNDELAIIEPF
ncbi:MAG TPA: glycosyltransferase, partial [Verrucomicrobiae bacterium]|nr:glycosyltransferase [Verrucomicrobiae bacterium]